MQEPTIERNDEPQNRNSRRLRYSAWFKLLAVLVALAGALNAAYAALNFEQISKAFGAKNYEYSMEYRSQMRNVLDDAMYVGWQYHTDGDANGTYDQQEDSIRDHAEENLRALQAQYDRDISSLRESEKQYAVEPTPTLNAGGTAAPQPTPTLSPAMLDRKRQLEQDIAAEKQSMEWELQRLQETRAGNDARAAAVTRGLNELDGILYAVVSPDGYVLTNTGKNVRFDELFAQYPHRLVIENGRAQTDLYYGIPNMPKGASAYVAMADEEFEALQSAYLASRTAGMQSFMQMALGGLATLAGLAWLLYAAGRRPARAGVVLMVSDRVYLDIQLALYAAVFGFCFYGAVNIANTLMLDQRNTTVNRDIFLLAYQALVAIVVLFGILLLTSFAKRIKRGELLRHTLIFAVLRLLWRGLRWVARGLRGLVMGLKASTRFVSIFLGYAACLGLLASLFGWNMRYGSGGFGFFLFVLGFATTGVMLAYILHKTVSFKNLSAAVRRIQGGELGARVPTGGGPEFRDLADSINHIADGLKAAVESEVKAERMRAELVTNVSHDLKTPLTSIVTYVDLLKTEGLASENAPHYLDVIDQKAARLKTLTTDLFEAAKASSGTMPVNLERVDAGSLLAQGLGELSDRIAAARLDFKLQLPSDRLLLRADGRLLWRVMENLLSNVFKYALPGSRVYLSAARAGSRGVLTLKNISAYELNIAPEELTERFTRGDAARHSEGSGLGLAIARSLTELQGGDFRIDIDGDLFKVTVSVPLWEE